VSATRDTAPVRALAPVVVLVALATVSCGKKGPLLPPFVYIPAAVEKIDARRLGDEVFLSFTVPERNVDDSTPPALEHLEVRGYTGTAAPPRSRWGELSSLIATIPVAARPDPAAGEGRTARLPGGQVYPGSVVTVLDTLDADDKVAHPVELENAAGAQGRGPAEPVAPAGPLRRYYAAVPFTPKGMSGPFGAPVDVPLLPVPPPPDEVHASYTHAAVTLTWTPSGGVLGYLLDAAAQPAELPPSGVEPVAAPAANAPLRPDALPAGPTGYNVYRRMEVDPLAPLPAVVPSAWNAGAPTPVNSSPLRALTLVDPVRVNRRVCYSVRAVRGTAPLVVEGPPSEPICFVPVDAFPPAAPTALTALPAEGSINLIWQPIDDPDAGGYLVLRGTAADATLQTLTPSPIALARYTDTAVTPGVRYVYAVVAVDQRLPVPNVSVESNRVEETAR